MACGVGLSQCMGSSRYPGQLRISKGRKLSSDSGRKVGAKEEEEITIKG